MQNWQPIHNIKHKYRTSYKGKRKDLQKPGEKSRTQSMQQELKHKTHRILTKRLVKLIILILNSN
jgi:hypothetical protein